MKVIDAAKLRFMKYVNIQDNGCWFWIGGKRGRGYGNFWTGEKQEPAHRVAYELFVGSIPEGLWVLHHCDNPPCVNPDHLFLGDRSLNMKDAADKKRHQESRKTHCPHGHPYSGDNLIVNKNGYRICKECKRNKATTDEYRKYHREYISQNKEMVNKKRRERWAAK
jgi:hypothetical protein